MIIILNVSRLLLQTVADSIRTAGRDSAVESNGVGRCELAIAFEPFPV